MGRLKRCRLAWHSVQHSAHLSYSYAWPSPPPAPVGPQSVVPRVRDRARLGQPGPQPLQPLQLAAAILAEGKDAID